MKTTRTLLVCSFTFPFPPPSSSSSPHPDSLCPPNRFSAASASSCLLLPLLLLLLLLPTPKPLQRRVRQQLPLVVLDTVRRAVDVLQAREEDLEGVGWVGGWVGGGDEKSRRFE